MTLTHEQIAKLTALREELLRSTKFDERDAAIHTLCGFGLAEHSTGIPRITAQGLVELARHGIGEMPHHALEA